MQYILKFNTQNIVMVLINNKSTISGLLTHPFRFNVTVKNSILLLKYNNIQLILIK